MILATTFQQVPIGGDPYSLISRASEPVRADVYFTVAAVERECRHDQSRAFSRQHRVVGGEKGNVSAPERREGVGTNLLRLHSKLLQDGGEYGICQA